MGADEKNLSRGRKVGLVAAALLAAALSCAALTRGCAPAPAPGSDAGSRPAAAAGPAARDGEAVSENPDEPAQPENAPADEPAAHPDGGAAPQKPADEPARGQTLSKPSGGSNGGASKPSHQHAWVHHDAVYETVHHDAVYNSVWHPPVQKTVVVCLNCGATDPGFSHMEAHALAGENKGTTTKTIVVQEGYNEQVLVSDAWDEQMLVSDAHDECSCGARR